VRSPRTPSQKNLAWWLYTSRLQYIAFLRRFCEVYALQAHARRRGLLALITPGGASAGPIEDEHAGNLASAHGDYAKAVRLYQSSAEQRDAAAQSSLGYLYENGYGSSERLGDIILIPAESARLVRQRDKAPRRCRRRRPWRRTRPSRPRPLHGSHIYQKSAVRRVGE
jgi:TPR repeat protein